jgi:hypothetical protein
MTRKIQIGDDLKKYLKDKERNEKITCREYAEPRKCHGCYCSAWTFYCLGPFSIEEMQCAQCFVDWLMSVGKKVI